MIAMFARTSSFVRLVTLTMGGVALVTSMVPFVGCASPRIDRPSGAAVVRGEHAGIRYERSETTVIAPGFDPDPKSHLFVVEALNKAVDGEAKDAPVKASVVIGPDVAVNAAAIGGSGPYVATITTEAGEDKVTTKETGIVGSPPLAMFSLVAMAVGTAAISVGSALVPLDVGIAPTLGLAGCGIAALGCGFGAGAVQTQMVEKDASELLARTVQKHAADVRNDDRIAGARREIGPAPRAAVGRDDDDDDDDDDDRANAKRVASASTQSKSIAAPVRARGKHGLLDAEWFAGIDGKQVQMSSDELANAVERGRVVGATLVWRDGMAAWQQARDVDELDDVLRGNGWTAAIDGKPVGPLRRDQLIAHVSAGKVGAATLVWRAGMKEWVRADSVQELSGVLFDVEE